MWLVLCEANDAAALWAHQGLQKRGLAPLELVSPDMLARGLRWNHRVGADSASIEISLAQDRTIHSDTIYGVLNRFVTVPTWHLHNASADDRDYASQELAAFFLSWLYALPRPVLNRPTPQGLSGRWRHESEWAWLASRAGLPTPAYRYSSHNHANELNNGGHVSSSMPVSTVIIIKGYVVGAAAPPDILGGCQRLAELATTELLGIDFADGEADPWTFVGATPLPDLRVGGQTLLDVLAEVLQEEVTTSDDPAVRYSL